MGSNGADNPMVRKPVTDDKIGFIYFDDNNNLAGCIDGLFYDITQEAAKTAVPRRKQEKRKEKKVFCRSSSR